MHGTEYATAVANEIDIEFVTSFRILFVFDFLLA